MTLNSKRIFVIAIFAPYAGGLTTHFRADASAAIANFEKVRYLCAAALYFLKTNFFICFFLPKIKEMTLWSRVSNRVGQTGIYEIGKSASFYLTQSDYLIENSLDFEKVRF